MEVLLELLKDLEGQRAPFCPGCIFYTLSSPLCFCCLQNKSCAFVVPGGSFLPSPHPSLATDFQILISGPALTLQCCFSGSTWCPSQCGAWSSSLAVAPVSETCRLSGPTQPCWNPSLHLNKIRKRSVCMLPCEGTAVWGIPTRIPAFVLPASTSPGYSAIVMTSRLRALGGRINNIRTSELPREKTRSEVVCSIRFLDGLVQTFKVNKQDTGQVLLDMAYNHLGVTEKEYFGLQHGDDSVDSPRWLEASKPIRKQLKGGFPCTLHFRVRFFIPDPNTLQQEQTRHLYFLQLKMDICEGRLTCPLNSAVVLASYAVQSHFGDHDSSIHHPGYLSDSQFIPDQNDDFLTKVESLHEQHSGLKQSEAESCFINIARTLDFYGVELHGGRDLHNLDLMIGIASAGIAVYRKYICTSFYPWVNILKISFKRKKFFIHQRRKQTESREHIVAFNMLNYRSCKNLWKSCVEHHTFFQAKKLLPQEKNVLSQYWTLGSRNPKKSVNNQYCKKVIGGMVWNPAMRRSLSVEHLETKSLPSRSPPITPNWRSPRLRHEIRKPRHSSADNLVNEMTYITETEDVFYTYKGSLSPRDSDSEVSQNRSPHRESISKNNPAQSCLTRKSSSSVSPSSNAPGSCSPDGVDQQFLEALHRVTKAGSAEDSSQYYCDKNDGDGYLVLIRITPDEDGKFGFNLKGGVDQKMPLVVSRINPESPADTCIPKLNEGDQIVLINGRDISEHTHDQVVMFIKASRESHTRELALVIRRKAVHSFADIKSEDELNQLFPEAIFPVCPEGGDTLEVSMEQLKKGLESGTVLIQFEIVWYSGTVFSVSVNTTISTAAISDSEQLGNSVYANEARGADGAGN
ncbi:tyrosine-protein phosphatase non-receptor type 3 isoform X5 [Camelus bactrianus]|uniref:Tyrosine-protein phosphatase non-receptor type 3 isoform X5 n=1 Tax=Camelus bactrianus TaxID=9837 RepID=A0AC58Q709_CAMBA